MKSLLTGTYKMCISEVISHLREATMKGTLLTGTGMFLYFGEVFAQLQELTNRAFSSLQSSESSRYKLPIFIFREGIKCSFGRAAVLGKRIVQLMTF